MIYGQLERLARAYMVREKPGHLLQETGLISEAYLRLVRLKAVDWLDRKHFFRVCAQLMRHILTDYARAKLKLKREGNAQHVSLGEGDASTDCRTDLLALDDALQSLSAIDPRKAQVVELKFFGGFSVRETADLLNISERTVKQDWQVAKLWLLQELNGTGRHE